jgi:uncharacterized protein involved in response to NO
VPTERNDARRTLHGMSDTTSSPTEKSIQKKTQKQPRPNQWVLGAINLVLMVTLAIITDDTSVRVVAIVAAIISAVNAAIQFRREWRWYRENG